MFNYNWNLSDRYPAVKYHGKTVFSCFACGGGSTMGYKLAGYNVLGCNEIDEKMINIYKKNHNPKYLFNCDIREFLKIEKPKELYSLDILDGSPPCSSFSISGNREKDWGKKKKFREGQKEQILDDLFFYYLDLAAELKPKIIIAENVQGLMLGNAKRYTAKIRNKFIEIGYNVQLFLLDSSKMGVPQKRKRCFFIAVRNELFKKKLVLFFNQKEIPFKEIEDVEGPYEKIENKMKLLWNNRKASDKDLARANEKLFMKRGFFSSNYVKKNKVVPTIISNSGSRHILYNYPRYMTKKEILLASSFPQDFNFLDQKYYYVCGMSVPPVMMANISNQIYKQWLQNTK